MIGTFLSCEHEENSRGRPRCNERRCDGDRAFDRRFLFIRSIFVEEPASLRLHEPREVERDDAEQSKSGDESLGREDTTEDDEPSPSSGPGEGDDSSGPRSGDEVEQGGETSSGPGSDGGSSGPGPGSDDGKSSSGGSGDSGSSSGED